MRRELVDLYLAKFSHVTNLLAFEGAEIGGDAAGLEVDDTGKGFVEQRADGLNREAAGFGLRKVSMVLSSSLLVGKYS